MVKNTFPRLYSLLCLLERNEARTKNYDVEVGNIHKLKKLRIILAYSTFIIFG